MMTNELPAPRPRTCGFRFSITDAIVILIVIAGGVALWPITGPAIALLPAVALGHFFLFCNVFRIHRKLELTWAALFVANVVTWLMFDQFDWVRVLAVQTPITMLLIALEIRSPRYHGIFCRTLNRRHLHDYLAGRV